MLVKIFGSAVFGVEATTITVEVNIDKGIGYHLVGLPDNAIKESSYRISAALNNNAYKLPGKKITINMAPADLRKEGSSYDLPIAIGLLASTGQMEFEELDKFVFMGELSLDGGLRPIKGALPIAIQARKEGFKGLFLPKENAREAAIVNNLDVFGISGIGNVLSAIKTAKYYELTSDEDYSDLFSYGNGFSASADINSLRVERLNKEEVEFINISEVKEIPCSKVPLNNETVNTIHNLKRTIDALMLIFTNRGQSVTLETLKVAMEKITNKSLSETI